jgi:hypothetical protein
MVCSSSCSLTSSMSVSYHACIFGFSNSTAGGSYAGSGVSSAGGGAAPSRSAARLQSSSVCRTGPPPRGGAMAARPSAAYDVRLLQGSRRSVVVPHYAFFLNCLLAVSSSESRNGGYKTYLSQPHLRKGERVKTAVRGRERWQSLRRAECVCEHACMCV